MMVNCLQTASHVIIVEYCYAAYCINCSTGIFVLSIYPISVVVLKKCFCAYFIQQLSIKNRVSMKLIFSMITTVANQDACEALSGAVIYWFLIEVSLYHVNTYLQSVIIINVLSTCIIQVVRDHVSHMSAYHLVFEKRKKRIKLK